MKKVKIIFFIYQLGAGGAARTMLNILNNIDRRTFTPILVTLDYNGSYEAYLKEDIQHIKLPTKRLRSAIFPFAKVIRKEQADIVFSTIPNYNTIAILARILSRTKAKNIVREAAYLGGSRRENAKLKVYGRLYRFASHVIALSNGVKENIVKRYKVPEQKIRVIYNPVDLQNIQEKIETASLPAKYATIFQSDKKVLVTAGRLVKDKDQETLLRGFHRLKKKTAFPVKLFILGEGPLQESLQEVTRELSLEEDVYFIGFQENPYLYVNRADVFVLSSLHEGFGHVLAEALAAGTPVVSTNAKPGAGEVLANGRYGVLTPVGDPEALAEAIAATLHLTEEEREKRKHDGKKRAADFDAPVIVKQYEEVFLQVMRQHKSRIIGDEKA